MAIMLLSLRAKIFCVLALLVVVTVAGASSTMWLTYRIGSMITSIIDTDVAALNASQELQSSLAMQKGLLTYYFLDGNEEWLRQLDARKQAFEDWLKKARLTSFADDQREVLNDIESSYIRYNYSREQVVALYRTGDRDAGLRLHQQIREQFFSLLDLCERYKVLHEQSITAARDDLHSKLRSINLMSLVAVPGSIALGLLMAYILLNQVLEPVRRMAATGPEGTAKAGVPDEVKALSQRVKSLIEDVDQTHTQLQLSREHLLQTEKLAMVGKLAAGVAHTIRNPLTSVKMRLFSMQRTLDLSATEKEDFEVISDEIRHIDTIVRNFLEFSRPPKLKIQKVSLSDVVDMAIQLLRHRIESYGASVELYRNRRLPPIDGDPEQLKEVLVNLIINSCEAMTEGGVITIREEEGFSDPKGHVVVLRLSDNGPGIPESIKEEVFQPFFTTKGEGTGLGLSIAARIVEDHRGCLTLRSREGKGTTFIITIPCKEDRPWLRS